MKNINKIAIIIAWPRELDMYGQIIYALENEIVLIVDDQKYSQKQRAGSSLNIIKILNEKNLKFELLSEVYKCKKYKVLLSTGASYKEIVSFKNIMQVIYSRTLGVFLQKTKISLLLKKIFGRGFSHGGMNHHYYTNCNIERELGLVNVCLPMGMDLSLKSYPVERWRKIFDIYFCHGIYDEKIIKAKFKNKEFVNIGYPRYNGLQSHYSSKKLINEEFNISDNKDKLIFWIPTDIKLKEESLSNILLWAPIVSKFTNNYNIIVRPHPKTIVTHPEIVDILIKFGFHVDLQEDRKLGLLYQAADLVLADYGGSVLSAIYLQRPLLLLDLPVEYSYRDGQIKGRSLDQIAREDLISISYEEKEKISDFEERALSDNNMRSIKEKKYEYFGHEKDSKNIWQVVAFLKNQLD
ncbi:MAG: CDP-glycerol glycerophosphotransferase family protein [Gammaproteobacteria bacterium]|nr:CDP-glycerol glycerophosphotransferase family protein [Gammaproteobacteria bacterium]